MRFTIKQAAEHAGVSPNLVYQWCQERRLPHYRLGGQGRRGKILIDEGDLDAFVVSCRQEARPEILPLKHIQLNHG